MTAVSVKWENLDTEAPTVGQVVRVKAEIGVVSHGPRSSRTVSKHQALGERPGADRSSWALEASALLAPGSWTSGLLLWKNRFCCWT